MVSDVLALFLYIFNRFVSLIFTDLVIFGVPFGWLFFSFVVICLLLNLFFYKNGGDE